MTLEDLLYTRLTGPEGPADMLAKYNGKPAVFYQTAPEDTADGWGRKPQYPRLDFIVDMQANPERHTSGVMTLNLWCSETGEPPESIEPTIRECLRDIFLKPDEGPPFSLAWVRSDAFDTDSREKLDTLITGVTMTFDLFAFPRQETTDPDPVLAINEFVKAWAPTSIVIGKDDMRAIEKADAQRPFFYFRLATLQSAQETNTVAWMEGTLAGHIYAPEEARLAWLKALVDALAIRGEVTMLDTSPMFLRSIKADSAADALTTGQLRLNIRFGLLRRPKYAHTIIQAYKPV